MLTRLERFIAVVFLLALAVSFRAPRLTRDWPFPFCHEVQLTSALAARNIWLTHYKKDLTPQESKWLELKAGRFVEPPLLQHLTAVTYAIAGEEVPWVSSFFSALFWLIGGLYLFRIARRTIGDDMGAVAALGFYYLTPYGILLSMSFQPEALLVLSFLISVYQVLAYPLSGGWKNALRVSLVSGLLALSKPGLSLIPLYALFFSMNSWGSKDRFYKSPKQLFFYFFVPLPSIGYMVWRTFNWPVSFFSISDGGFLSAHLTLDFLNHLALLPTIPQYIILVVSLAAFGFGLWSVLLWGNSLVRRVYFGLLAGYLGNLIFFVHALGDFDTYRILASYYHWPLIPLTAIGIGVAAKNLAACLSWERLKFGNKAIFSMIVLRAFVVLALPALKQSSSTAIPDTPLYQLINSKVPRGERAIVLSNYMTQDVRFFSWLHTQSWWQEMEFLKLATQEKYVELEFKIRSIVEKSSVPYLIIVLNKERPDRLEMVKRFERHPKILEVSNLVIYDVQSWIPKGDKMKVGAAERQKESSSL